MDLEKRLADYQAFLRKVDAMKGAYESSRDVQVLEDGVRKLTAYVRENGKHFR